MRVNTGALDAGMNPQHPSDPDTLQAQKPSCGFTLPTVPALGLSTRLHHLKKKKYIATAPGKAEGSAAFVRLQAGPQPATCPSWAQGIALAQALQQRPQPPLLFVKWAAEPRDPRASSFSDQQGDDDRRNELNLSQFSLT